MRVFLSYARDDDERFVARLAEALDAASIGVWFDRRSMPSRSLAFLDEIRRAIDGVDRVIAVMGPAALGSEYVRCEWQYALIRDKPVVPILRLGEYHLPPELRNLHCPDVRASRPWDAALEEILRLLREPLPELGAAVGLPSLPPHFRPRPSALSLLASSVLIDLQQPANPERWQRVTLLSGMGGAGKSVLAGALARSTETRRAFVDGIYWLDMRRVPQPETGLEALTQLVASRQGAGSAATVGPAEQRLTAMLRGRRCLFVIDNVGSVAQLEGVVRCLDTTGRVLVTTREGDLVGEAHHVPLSGLEDPEARQQLADWIQLSPHAFDADCDMILQVCDGLPFAIALCGSLIASGVPRASVAAKLRSMDLPALERRFPDYEYPGLLPCLEVSVEAIERARAGATACFERMVVFAPGAAIPETTVALFWQKSLGMDEATCGFELARLCNHSLLRAERERGAVSVHQLIHTYLCLRVADQPPLHEELLAAYATRASRDWLRGPDDGYYYANLVKHLLVARGIDPVCDLLVGSPAWMWEKLRVEGNSLSYLVDVQLALDALDNAAASILPRARLAAARHLVRKGPRSFGGGVLKAMVRLGMTENALELARANVDPQSRIGQLLEIYETLREKGDDRCDLLVEVERSVARNPDVVLVADVYSKLIMLYAGAARLDDALRLWRGFPERWRDAAKWLRLALSRRLADTGRLADAKALEPELPQFAVGSRRAVDFDAAEREALATEDKMLGDAALLGLARDLINNGQPERAHAVAHGITRVETRMIALAEIPWEPALQEVLDIARTLDGVQRGLGLMSAAEMLSRRHTFVTRASLLDRVGRWFGRRPPSSIKETTVELMAEAERAIETVDPTVRSITLRYMALLPHTRARGESRRLLQAARQAANAIEEPHRHAMELAEIAGDLARLDDAPETIAAGRALLTEAMTLAEASSDPKASARARAAVAAVLARNGRCDIAIGLAEQISDETERQGAWDRIGDACASAGDPACLERLHGRSSVPEKMTRQLAIALTRAGRYEDAMKTMADVRDEDTVTEIARALVGRGDAGRALRLLDAQAERGDTSYQRVGVLAEIARADAEPAITMAALERGRTIAEGLRSTTHKSMAYAELARAEAALGDTRGAVASFEKAVELANTNDEAMFPTLLGPSSRFSALKAIGERMADAGFPEKTLAIANSLEHEKDDEWLALRAHLIATVAARGSRTGTADAQRVDELFGMAIACASGARNSMIGPPWRVIALMSVAERFVEAGRWASAFDAISQAHFTIDPFLIGIAGWAESFESTTRGLSLSVIEAVARVFGWQRPDLTKLAEEIVRPEPAS